MKNSENSTLINWVMPAVLAFMKNCPDSILIADYHLGCVG